MAEISEGKTRNSHGDPMSSYYEIALDEDGNSLSVSVTLDRDHEDGHQWYVIYIVDDILDIEREPRATNTALLYELILTLQEVVNDIL